MMEPSTSFLAAFAGPGRLLAVLLLPAGALGFSLSAERDRAALPAQPVAAGLEVPSRAGAPVDAIDASAVLGDLEAFEQVTSLDELEARAGLLDRAAPDGERAAPETLTSEAGASAADPLTARDAVFAPEDFAPATAPRDVVEEVLATLAASGKAPAPPPPLVHPLADRIADSRPASLFGDPRPGGRSHAGIDLPADKGTPVRAVADGRVRWLHDEAGGNCCALALVHDDGWRSRYIHLDNDAPGTDDGQAVGIAPGLARGTRVVAGEIIGWVGDSGNAEHTIPHLHFELRSPQGVPVDPGPFLAAAARATVTEDAVRVP